MNERLKNTLHRWLPKLTILSVLVFLFSLLFAEHYVRPIYDDAAKIRQEKHEIAHEAKQATRAKAEQAKKNEARAVLERLVGLIDTLDGNSQTQAALSAAVAQEEVVSELWVTNAHGLIVYYGRHHPPVRNVADVPLGALTPLLDMVPEDVLSPLQRTAVLLPAVIGGYHYNSLSSRLYDVGGDIILKHLTIAADAEEIIRYADLSVEMARVKDGLIAVAVTPKRWSLETQSLRQSWEELGTQSLGQSWEEGDRLRLWLNIITLVALIGLILFWLSIPAWMALDAQKRRERAAVWGLFGLLGNMIALVVYLLVRQNNGEDAQ